MDDAFLLLKRFSLALCVWREGRGESQLGKVLIAQVVENRVNDSRWPDTYVGVITQPLQFSSFNRNDPNSVKFPRENDSEWLECVNAADTVLRSVQSFTTANHYHTKNIMPSWADPKKITNKEGNHVFYRL